MATQLSDMGGFPAFVGGAADPLWNKVVSLLHFRGANTSTVFPDIKAGGVWTPSGTAQISTAQSKFDGTALALNGSGAFLTSASNPGFAYGTGDFCEEAWLYANDHSDRTPWGGPSSNAGCYGILLDSAPQRRIYFATTVMTGALQSFPVSQWFHLALCRKDGWIYALVNLQAAAGNNSSSSVTSTQRTIGRALFNDFNGYVGGFRATAGDCRYPPPASVPTAQFPAG